MLLTVLVAAGIVALAFALRVGIHAGRTPGGVDTWYYLAYADAFRRRPSFRVELPQYLLQDLRQSYPPVFPSLLALLPRRFLQRWFWTVSPAIDCVHLILLYAVALRLTGSVAVAAIAAATYAFMPQLISETRSLSSRPFGALVHSVAMIFLLKAVSTPDWRWAVLAAFVAAFLYLSSAAMAAAYAFVNAAMAFVFSDARLVIIPVAGFVIATVLSGGHMLRVVQNYWFAIHYWQRNRHLYGRHPVRDSPVLAESVSEKPAALHTGFMGETTGRQLIRLLGENPFLFALAFAKPEAAAWGLHLYSWAVILASLSFLATVLPPLRAFGPGRSYMKAAIFPTAYTLAAGIGTAAHLLTPPGLITIACLVASIGAIAFFYLHTRARSTEVTAFVPEGLSAIAARLAELPEGPVFVLPFMYADYVSYRSSRPIVWGGHSGRHDRLEWITPVIRRPLDELFRELRVRYLILDESYVSVAELRIGSPLREVAGTGPFRLYEWSETA